MNIIEIENLWYRYSDGTTALKGMSMAIPQGKKTALLGPNGAGKSTILLHFNGINLPQEGSVRVLGKEIDRETERWVRTKVGLVFQDPDDQVFASTVWEDVAFGPTNLKLSHQEIEHRVEDALQAVGMLDLRNKAPHHLSYGQKKRVAIAGVLAMKPEVIVIDEPVAYLDPKGKSILFTILNELHASGTTIVIATHDVDLAAEWAENIIIIKDGQTLASGDTSLLTRADLIQSADLQFPIVTRIFLGLPELQLKEAPRTIEGAIKTLKDILKLNQ
ncbi:ATP-binding cassette domain-containing protein [Bacillota bacterium LX-D]|nr:ATP-binding cassette domain-containing protein [Bacillota bacterium LX-D]